MSKRHVRSLNETEPDLYAAFDQLDGRHPWQSAVPDGYVLYPVQRLSNAKIAYFNFGLARDMGLIGTTHPQTMTKALAQKVLDTFALQIINEFDQARRRRSMTEKPQLPSYMATRYLQMQHADKRGRTSGDGRSIWNGTVRHKNVTWDVSSRGTGVTRLAPGAVSAGRPLQTGRRDVSYGCGRADLGELLSSAVMSEIFHLSGIGTERVLAIIDIGDGSGIGVRAAPNLLRPAHLFLYLKQGRLTPLRQACDYLIHRQTENGEWTFPASSAKRYRLMLDEIAIRFARFAARLERNYIFAWLDWDGDNVLTNAGIIDYGSIRQFGLRHDQYRFDDITRFSTHLGEQAKKARETVQVFAQAVDFIEQGRKAPMDQFRHHSAVNQFDRHYHRELRRIFLEQAGLSATQVNRLMSTNRRLVEDLYGSFIKLERTKTRVGQKQLPDGINRPAVFNMRTALREWPKRQLEFSKDPIAPQVIEEFLILISSSFATRLDRSLRPSLRAKITAYLSAYHRLFTWVIRQGPQAVIALQMNAETRNRAGRLTGNGAEFVIDAVMRARDQGLAFDDLQTAIRLFVLSQGPANFSAMAKPALTSLQSPAGRLFQEMVSIAHEFEEDI